MKESHARANCLSRRENVETRNSAMHTREFTMGGNKLCGLIPPGSILYTVRL
jgi:hypothetical protein